MIQVYRKPAKLHIFRYRFRRSVFLTETTYVTGFMTAQYARQVKDILKLSYTTVIALKIAKMATLEVK